MAELHLFVNTCLPIASNLQIKVIKLIRTGVGEEENISVVLNGNITNRRQEFCAIQQHGACARHVLLTEQFDVQLGVINKGCH
jgi:hypothetical protein